jgi:hypothetical protein
MQQQQQQQQQPGNMVSSGLQTAHGVDSDSPTNSSAATTPAPRGLQSRQQQEGGAPQNFQSVVEGRYEGVVAGAEADKTSAAAVNTAAAAAAAAQGRSSPPPRDPMEQLKAQQRGSRQQLRRQQL